MICISILLFVITTHRITPHPLCIGSHDGSSAYFSIFEEDKGDVTMSKTFCVKHQLEEFRILSDEK